MPALANGVEKRRMTISIDYFLQVRRHALTLADFLYVAPDLVGDPTCKWVVL